MYLDLCCKFVAFNTKGQFMRIFDGCLQRDLPNTKREYY